MNRLKPRSAVWWFVLVAVGSCTAGAPQSTPPMGLPAVDAGQSEGMAGLPTGMLPDGSDTPAPDANRAALPDGSGTAMQDGNDSQGDVGTGDVAAVGGGCTSQFCETFEEYQSGAAPDPARWSLDGSPVVIDSIQPHSGKLALHVPAHNGATCTDGAAKCLAARFIRLTGAFPTSLHKQFYGRVFFYIAQQAGGGFYHWTVMEAGAGTSYSGGLAVRMGGHIEGGAEFLRFHMDTHMHQIMPFEYGLSDTQATIKAKTWYCLEWYYDAPGNEAKFWLDGTERPMLHYKGPMAGQPQFTFPPEFQSVAFGWRVYQTSTQPFEVFVDDIALDAQKIGCN